MLVPSNKLKTFIDTFASQRAFSEVIDIDEGRLSKLYNHKAGATSAEIEKIQKLIDLPYEDAWETK